MGIPAWASVGYKAVEERARQVEEASKTRLFRFTLGPDQEATIRFLTVEPVTFYEHFLPDRKRTFTCLRTQDQPLAACPFCAAGNKPVFRGAYVVLDLRKETWTDRQTGEARERQYTPKVLKFGVRTLQVLAKLHTKRNLANWDWEVMRTGTGTDTSYTFANVEKANLPKEVMDQLSGVDWMERLIRHLEPLSREQALEVLGGKMKSSQTDDDDIPDLQDISEDADVITF